LEQRDFHSGLYLHTPIHSTVVKACLRTPFLFNSCSHTVPFSELHGWYRTEITNRLLCFSELEGLPPHSWHPVLFLFLPAFRLPSHRLVEFDNRDVVLLQMPWSLGTCVIKVSAGRMVDRSVVWWTGSMALTLNNVDHKFSTRYMRCGGWVVERYHEPPRRLSPPITESISRSPRHNGLSARHCPIRYGADRILLTSVPPIQLEHWRAHPVWRTSYGTIGIVRQDPSVVVVGILNLSFLWCDQS